VQNSNYKKLHLLKKNLFLKNPKNLPHLTTNTHMGLQRDNITS